MKVIVVSLCRGNQIFTQEVRTNSQLATEIMIGWLKDIAYKMGVTLKEFTDLENKIRMNCYYGCDEGNENTFYIKDYLIHYKEHHIPI